MLDESEIARAVSGKALLVSQEEKNLKMQLYVINSVYVELSFDSSVYRILGLHFLFAVTY